MLSMDAPSNISDLFQGSREVVPSQTDARWINSASTGIAGTLERGDSNLEFINSLT